jgi:hypothetical protein
MKIETQEERLERFKTEQAYKLMEDDDLLGEHIAYYKTPTGKRSVGLELINNILCRDYKITISAEFKYDLLEEIKETQDDDDMLDKMLKQDAADKAEAEVDSYLSSRND